ncbi:Rid family hydrolase [Natronorubrum sp. DTA28]|uniref:Rid family hydrolase n=1 Tax=Natronorubrum sp. DTA28 TaxID=3447019 RepID=UPI003F860424
MEKIVLGPAMGELDDGTEPAMSVGVATECAAGLDVSLSGLIHPDGSPIEQARRIFEIIEEIIEDDLDGDLTDITLLRFYVRDDALTTELRQQLHELRRDLFDYPDFPAATMIGVSRLVDEDAALEIEVEAVIPDGEWEKTVITPDE